MEGNTILDSTERRDEEITNKMNTIFSHHGKADKKSIIEWVNEI